MTIDTRAGMPPQQEQLADIPKVITAYYAEKPEPKETSEQVSFGTSGHRGSALKRSFNENHILAITQAICEYRQTNGVTGPLFLGRDTHALSYPAFASALEVLAANQVQVMISDGDDYTPTPVISHAILTYNRGRTNGLADGIVITPSHNPPDEGGFKYNPPNGGPAEDEITKWVQTRANEYLQLKLHGVKRVPFSTALHSQIVTRYGYADHYIADLNNVVDMNLLRDSQILMGVDPLGGAGVHYWRKIADRYKLNLKIISEEVDPTFRFMSLDWDGQIRMDPSSPYAMHKLINLRDNYEIAFACDTDHDRHGIVTKSGGLMQPNHYLSAAVNYLFSSRPNWNPTAMVGKTLVSSSMIDKAASKQGRKVYEVPVGFKWFVEGLFSGFLAFGGEESAGASFNRFDGSVWTTDKDGVIPSLLAGEMTARLGKDPAMVYKELTKEFGEPFYTRKEAKATPEQKSKLKKLSADQVQTKALAGEPIENILTKAPGNNAPIGGVKVTTANGWFAARPSGTEDIYKIYAESFISEAHLQKILEEAQALVDKAL